MRRDQRAADNTPLAAPFYVLRPPASLWESWRLEQVSGTYRPFAGDFDGNGRDDILWYAPGGAGRLGVVDQAARWGGTTGHGVGDLRGVTLAGDFNGDGKDDVCWYAPDGGPGVAGRSGGALTTTGATVNGTYEPVLGDFDGDAVGHDDDIIWCASGTASDSVWRGVAGAGSSPTLTWAPRPHGARPAVRLNEPWTRVHIRRPTSP